MHRNTCRALGAVVAAVVLFAAAAAEAVDAPRWVAAIFIQAQTAVGLRWNPVPGASGYKVLRSTSPGKDYAELGSVAQPQLIDSAVEPGTTYYYVLQAVAGAEASPNSDEKSVAIPGEKKVEEVIITDALPLTTNGNIMHRELANVVRPPVGPIRNVPGLHRPLRIPEAFLLAHRTSSRRTSGKPKRL